MTEMKEFNLKCFIDAANELVRADEVARALWLLDNLPAWYRDNAPDEVVQLKNEIMKRMATPSFYATDAGCELTVNPDSHLYMRNTLRGDLIVKDMKFLNKHNFFPKLFDLGPGEYWTPKLLIHEQVKFSYRPIYVNHPSHDQYRPTFHSVVIGDSIDQPKILFACEIIEHLWHEDEIRYEMNRHLGMADIIHLSTPCYTFDFNCTDWKKEKKDLGHLRAYTPTEFFMTVQKMFPEYILSMWATDILHIRGVNKKTSYDLIKNTKPEEIIAS